MTTRRILIAALAVLPGARLAVAQTPAPSAPPIDFSGLMFGSFNMRTDSAGKATLGGKTPNQFGIDRVYLTFRMPAGDNGSIRVTTDVFQNTSTATNGYYQGWAIRLKYAYFQYAGLKDAFGGEFKCRRLYGSGCGGPGRGGGDERKAYRSNVA